jgi:hypothetical protein
MSKFEKKCGHTKPVFGCRGCIAEAAPTLGNVAQTAKAREAREALMLEFMQARREREARLGRLAGLRENARVERAEEAEAAALSWRMKTCGHTHLRFGCDDCMASANQAALVLERPLALWMKTVSSRP